MVIAAVILATGGKPPAPSTSQSTAVLAVKLALGVALVLYGVRRWRRRGTQRSIRPGWRRLDRVSLWAAAGLAIFLQPWALVRPPRQQ